MPSVRDLKPVLRPGIGHMQGWGAAIVGVVCLLAAMSAGHAALSRAVPGRRLLTLFLLVFTLQSALLLAHLLRPAALPLGLRALVGAGIPPLLYLFFARRIETGAHRLRRSDLLHLWPPLAVALLLGLPGGWVGPGIDAVMVLAEAGYAIALLSLNRARQRRFRVTRIGVPVAASFLLAAAVVDIGIAVELADGGVLSASWGLRIGIAVMLLLMLAVFLWAWRDPEWWCRIDGGLYDAQEVAPTSTIDAAETAAQKAEHEALCRQLAGQLQQEEGLREFGLTLSQISRRLGVPPKRLSQAVNAIHGRGFRTLLNDWRVEAAARQLRDPRLSLRSITDVMFDAGYQTKSSFNREFAQRMGTTPSEYRKRSLSSVDCEALPEGAEEHSESDHGV